MAVVFKSTSTCFFFQLNNSSSAEHHRHHLLRRSANPQSLTISSRTFKPPMATLSSTVSTVGLSETFARLKEKGKVLLELSNIINKKPLTIPIAGPGIALPPEQDTLISPNFQLAFPKKQQSEPLVEESEDDEATNPPPQEQQKATDLSQNAQRVSFQIGAKRTRSDFE